MDRGGNSKGDWYLWLKKKLEEKGFQVIIPEMPNTDEPKIEEWVPYLEQQAWQVDEETYFIGHSIGCQTILRYLENLPENIKIGGAVFVAGWFNLFPKIIEEEEGTEIAKPWIETPINFDKILSHTKKFVAIFSDNDFYVPMTDTKIFKEKLGAKIIIEHEKGHFNIEELPSVLNSILEMSKS